MGRFIDTHYNGRIDRLLAPSHRLIGTHAWKSPVVNGATTYANTTSLPMADMTYLLWPDNNNILNGG